MSLVAAYSDSESENETENENDETVSFENSDTNIVVETQEDLKSEITNSKVVVEEIEEENAGSFHIDDDDDEWQINVLNDKGAELDNAETTLFLKLPEPKNAKYEEITEEVEDEFLKKKAEIYIEQPKPTESEETKMEKEDLIFSKKSVLNLPKPGKKSGPVKISIPTLNEIGADSDSDNEDERKKCIKQSCEKSSLFSILPKPKHSVTVGNNKNRVFEKKENRSLIPYTLTKKAETNAPTNKKTSAQSIKNELKNKKSAETVESESDDEEFSSESFFSLTSVTGNANVTDELLKGSGNIKNEQNSVTRKLPASSTEKENSKQSSDVTIAANKKNSYFSSLLNKSKSSSNKLKEPISVNKKNSNLIDQNSKKNQNLLKNENLSKVKKRNGEIVARPCRSNIDNSSQINDVKHSDDIVTAPYEKNTEISHMVSRPYGNYANRTSNVTAPYLASNDVTAPYEGVYPNPTGSYGNANSSSQSSSHPNSFYTYPKKHSTERFFSYAYEEPQISPSKPQDYYNQPNEDLPIDQSALIALQGRKRVKTDINIIDINAEELQQNNQEHLKNLTKESSHRAKVPKKDQPSHVEKQKHQITYLAFQAKEKEHELRQQWAESRSSKQQTQSRYGF